MARIHYTNCPVCQSPQIVPALRAMDHTVSKETFDIVQCGTCTHRFTQDVPDAVSIGPYYQSEDYISHTDTSKGIVNRLYRYARKRTLVNKRRLLEKTTGMRAGHLLDVGSGVGAFVQEMEGAGWTATGLEPDAGARKIASEIYKVGLQDIDRLYHLPAESFDAITLWHVLEHVHDLTPYVQQLKNLLRPNGRIFIAVPNYTSVDAKAYQQFWAAYDVPRHLYHFSPQSMETLVKKNGLMIRSYRPMWYDSFYISLLSSRYKNGATNWIGAAVTGIRSNVAALFNRRRCSSIIYVITK